MDLRRTRDERETEPESTLQAPSRARAEPRLGLPALTVAAHPDPERIGEIAVLDTVGARGETGLGRLAPEFGPPDSPWSRRPLDDRFVSRRPLIMAAAPEGAMEIDRRAHPGEVIVDGRPLGERLELPAAALERGVTVELARRIVLVLHRIPLERTERRSTPHGLIGASTAIERVLAAVERVAGLGVPVLLRGESGTGKELVARAIHRSSGRAGGPFVAVNLGALPPELAAAELFGSVKGAFTGAVGNSEGYFRAADGGTLFLDEVGEARPELQVALLRSLETAEVYPVGSQRPRSFDVRLLAATDADLEARVAAGEFRAPLLHRLSAYEIRIPPLRERREDIGRLIAHFVAESRRAFGLETGDEAGAGSAIPAPLVARLVRHDWPGNVRQLANVVRQLVIDELDGDAEAGIERVERILAPPPAPVPAGAGEGDEPPPRRRRPGDLPDAEIERALGECGFEPSEAARRLGISRASLYNLIRRNPRLRTAEDVPAAEIEAALTEAGGDEAAAARRLGVSARALSRRLRRIQRSGGR